MQNQIGDRIKIFAKECYGSQKSFAESVTISQAHLNAYVMGNRTPGTDVLKKLNDAGMSIDWLLTGNGSMFADNEAGRELKNKFEPESNEIPESKMRLITEEELQRLAELAAKSTIEQLSIKAAATTKKKEE